MKIAVIKTKLLVPSPHAINTINHALGFSSLGNEVEILDIEELVTDRSTIRKNEIYQFYDIYNDINLRFFKGSLFFYMRELKLVRGFLNFIKKFPKIFDFLDPEKKVSNFCVKKKFDLVYCRDAFRVAYHNISNKIPTIVETHNFYLGPELIRLIEQCESNYFKGIITISDFLKQNLIKNGFPEDKILVLEDAVNLEKFEKITDDKHTIRKKLNLLLNKKMVLYTGSLHENRGITTLLNAAELLNNQQLVFYFIGGRKKPVKMWKKFLEENSIKANVQFLGYKQYGIIPFYLKAADLLLALYSYDVLTLKWMSPLKIFEYMASKTPFIATKVGRINEICNNNECLLTNPDDPIDLSEKIMKIITDEQIKKTIIQNSYEKAKKHTYKKRCEDIIKFSTRI